jgi:hypothetical protein
MALAGISANRLELLQIADAVAREKSIDRRIVIEAMEDAIQKAAKSRYGAENDIRCEIDARTGETRLAQLDLGLVARPVLEIRGTDERTIDARRGDLEPVAAGHEVVRIEQRGNLARDRLAIVDADAAVRPFGHDLHRLAIPPRHLDAHEAEPQVLQDRFDELRQIGGKPGLVNEAVVWTGATHMGTAPGSRNIVAPSVKTKRADPRGAHSQS